MLLSLLLLSLYSDLILVVLYAFHLSPLSLVASSAATAPAIYAE